MKQNRYLKLFTAFAVIMFMSIMGSVALDIRVLPCATVLTTGSALLSFLPTSDYSFLATVAPSIFEMGHKNYFYAPRFVSKRFPGASRFGSAAYKTDAEIEVEKKEAERIEAEKKEIKTSADLLKHLNETKANLEATVKIETKAEVTEQLKAVNAAIEELKGVKPEVTAAELKKIKDDLDITIKAFDKLQIILKRQQNSSGTQELKSFDQRLAEAVEESTDNIEKFKKGEIKKFALEIKAVGAVSTTSVGGTTVWGAQRRPDIIMNPNTMTHIRTLIPVTNAGPGTDYYFMYESGSQGSIAATAEATAAAAPTTQATGLKPQFDLSLVEASVKFEYIAGWMLMSRKAMNNIPGFSSFLQRRLPVKLMDAEDTAILYGNGTSPQIKGILTAGNYTASTAGAVPFIEKIIDDISLLEDTYKRLATGIAMRPHDYYSFFKHKASGSGEYDLPLGVIFVNGILYILGVPVAKTTGLNAGDYVVGDFENGTELLIQEAMRLEFFEQDATNVRSNQITVRIEESVALPVFGSNYFIKGSSAGIES